MKQMIVITLFAALCISLAYGEEEITILNGTSNSMARRDYSFLRGENFWAGKGLKSSAIFQTESRDMAKELTFRDKIFTQLNTNTPIIKSIDPQTGQTTEFNGKVIRRTTECLLVYWENDFANKFWVATIDLIHKKAIVTQTYYGMTSFGVDIETLDCV